MYAQPNTQQRREPLPVYSQPNTHHRRETLPVYTQPNNHHWGETAPVCGQQTSQNVPRVEATNHTFPPLQPYQYINTTQKQSNSEQGYFLDALLQWKDEILKEMDKKLIHLQSNLQAAPQPNSLTPWQPAPHQTQMINPMFHQNQVQPVH